MTSEAQFQSWVAQGFNYLPVIVHLKNNEDDPLTLYQKLANTSYSYLLESGMKHDTEGRYSFIGLSATTRIIVKGNQVTYIKNEQLQRELTVADPTVLIQEIIASFQTPSLKDFPRFIGGFVGYFGYDTIRYFEPKLRNPHLTDSLHVPDILLMLSDAIVIYDNVTKEVTLIVYATTDDQNAYKKAVQRIEHLQDLLQQPLNPTEKPYVNISPQPFKSNFLQADYEAGVLKAREYFLAGDAMQLILSQRFSKPYYGSPLVLYRTLCALNPSPYMYYLDLKDFYIVGASPEILVRIDHGEVTVKPLAGTRRRGKTIEEDQALEKELLLDEKEIAEHLMLIDLGRNDIGRVAKIGSVQLKEQMVIERFSHVMHISSTVTGQIKPKYQPIDVLRATFPAGTVSGAPKVRAMEIIDELEHEKRGIYGGAIGYIGLNGNVDLAIALRTAVIKDDMIYVQAGAGLVADSIPTQEWQECLNKAQALFAATTLAESNVTETTYDIND